MSVCSIVDLLCFLCLVFAMPLCASVDMWSPAGKGLASWLSFVVSYCEFVTSWVSIIPEAFMFHIEPWSWITHLSPGTLDDVLACGQIFLFLALVAMLFS